MVILVAEMQGYSNFSREARRKILQYFKGKYREFGKKIARSAKKILRYFKGKYREFGKKNARSAKKILQYSKGKYREFGKKIARSAKKIFARYGDGDGNFWSGMGVTVTVKKHQMG